MNKNIFKKIKSRFGFTMAEILVTVSIIVILFAVGAPAIITIRSNLRISKMDASARTIFIAAQNHMSEMSASNELSTLNPIPLDNYTIDDAPSDFPVGAVLWMDFKKDFAYLKSSDPEIAKLFPAASLDSKLLEGTFYIEYNQKTGTVYGVFFSDGFFEFDEVATVDNLRLDKSARKAHTPMIGYYGGSTVGWVNTEPLTPPVFKLINEEELYIKLNIESLTEYTVDIVDSFNNKYSLLVDFTTLYGTGNIDFNNRTGICIITLDSLKEGLHFKELFQDLAIGSDLTVTITATRNDTSETAGPSVENSLFARVNISEKTADIAYCRHLQNLEEEISGIYEITSPPGGGVVITSASQIAPLDWAKAITNSNFKPITNNALTAYNGNDMGIKNLNNSMFGIYGSTSANATLTRIKLIDSNISVDGATVDGNISAVGTLANITYQTAISNCSVYAEAMINTKAVMDVSVFPGGGSNRCYAGGLIGYAYNTTIATSSASLLRINCNADFTGGLIGGFVSTPSTASQIGQIDKCYADFGRWSGATNSWVDDSGIIANRGTVGGLLGYVEVKSALAVTSCYSAGNIRSIGNDNTTVVTAAGITGSNTNNSNTYRDCYSATTYAGLNNASTAYGLIGGVQVASNPTQTNCYFLKSARTLYATSNTTQPKDLSALKAALTFSVPGVWDFSNTVSTISAYGQTGNYPFPKIVGLNHYGAWSGEAKYTVVFWMEKPNVPFGFDTAETSNYSYACELPPLYGLPGEIVGGNIAPPTDDASKIALLQKQTDGTSATSNGMPYGSYGWTKSAQISSDGSATVNVYYFRNIYDLQFTINSHNIDAGTCASTFSATQKSDKAKGCVEISNEMLGRMLNIGDRGSISSTPAGVLADCTEAYKNGQSYFLASGSSIIYTIHVKYGENLTNIFPTPLTSTGFQNFNWYTADKQTNGTYIFQAWGPYQVSNVTDLSNKYFQNGTGTWANTYDKLTNVTANINGQTCTISGRIGYLPYYNVPANITLGALYYFGESLYQDELANNPADAEPNIDVDLSGAYKLKSTRLKVDKLLVRASLTNRAEVSEWTSVSGKNYTGPYFDLILLGTPYWIVTSRQVPSTLEGFTPIPYFSDNLKNNCYQWQVPNPAPSGMSGRAGEKIFYQLTESSANTLNPCRFFFLSRNSYKLNLFVNGKSITINSAVKYQMPLSKYFDDIKNIAEEDSGLRLVDFYLDPSLAESQKVDITTYTMPAGEITLYPKFEEITLPVGLVYYEKYSDGTYGYYGTVEAGKQNTDPLSETLDITESGYVYITKNTENIGTLTKFEKERAGSYYLYSIAKDGVLNTDVLAANHNFSLFTSQGSSFYFIPHFAKSVLHDATPTGVETLYIRTAQQFASLSTHSAFWSKTFEQQRDITIGTPPSFVGITTSPFSGTYDGQSHEITLNDNISSAAECVGLFGYNTGTLKNLIFISDDGTRQITGGKYTGALVGYNNGIINNCAVAGFTVSSSTEDSYVGGLVGHNRKDGTIFSCSAANFTVLGETSGGSVSASGSATVGGFIGENLGTINDCYTIATIADTLTNGSLLYGGFVGNAGSGGKIERCYSITCDETGKYILKFAATGSAYDHDTCNAYFEVFGDSEPPGVELGTLEEFIAKYTGYGGFGMVTEYTFSYRHGVILYPYPSSVKKDGNYIHYGDWP